MVNTGTQDNVLCEMSGRFIIGLKAASHDSKDKIIAFRNDLY